MTTAPPEASGNLTGTVVRGAGFAGVGYLLSQLITLGAYLALARLATPKDFGHFAAGSILVGAGALLAETGMPSAVIQRKDRLEEAASTALVATILAGIGITVLALGVSPLIGLFFRSRTTGLIAAAMSGYFVLRQATVIPNALMQRRFSIVRRAVLDPVAACAFCVTAVTACARGLGAWGLVAGTYASVLAELIVAWSFVGWRPRRDRVSFQMWRELMRFGRHVFAGEAMRRTTPELSTLLVGRFLGAAALGQFQYAARVASRPLDALVNTTAFVLFPAFARISDDEVRFRRACLRALRWTCVISFPSSLMLFALGKPTIVVVFGERWHDAGYAVMAMCLYTAGQSFSSLATEVFKAAGSPNLFARMQVLSMILVAVFMISLLPFGLYALAAGLSLRSVGVAVYAVRATGRITRTPIRLMLGEIWPSAVAALALGAATFSLDRLVVHADSHGVVAAVALLGAEGMLGVAVYLAVLTKADPDTAHTLFHAVKRARAALGRRSNRREPPSEAKAPRYVDV